MEIPREAQINAILNQSVSDLLQQYCFGSWLVLRKNWTVGMNEIVCAAKPGGLARFVRKPGAGEGFLLLEDGNGYAVCYIERGQVSERRHFTDLEAAFRCWLEKTMQSMTLPVLP
ncbi:hypothetical protein V8J88_06750 [Massilia sp. W12]|uniref:hypothetical protein n=1 Tax=Massilia sp. W12 TaxID=3126507 RepID=UPI0030D2D56A